MDANNPSRLSMRSGASCSIYQNVGPDHETFLQREYRELRDRRMKEYGWIELREGIRDHDRYDEVGADTLTVLIHTGSDRLRAGARVTALQGASVAESLSARMWPAADRNIIGAHEELRDRFAAGNLLDFTRLLLADTSRPTDAIVLGGACAAATSGIYGAYMTLHGAFLNLLRMFQVPIEVIHEGVLDGERCAFVMIRPPSQMDISSSRARRYLSEGAQLVDPVEARVIPFVTPQEIDLRDHPSVAPSQHPNSRRPFF